MSTAVFDNSATPGIVSSNAPDADGINPATRSSASITMMPRLNLMRACYGGTETMRQMGNTFLPQYPRETDERWVTRLNSTFAINKLQEAVDSASAKPFRNLLDIHSDDPDVMEWKWNADLRGHHLHLVAHKFFNEAVLTGQCHFLADYTTTSNLKSYADQKRMNVRPYLKIIKHEDLLGCVTEQVGGETRVVHARISSSRSQLNRRTFVEDIIDQVFVFEQDVVQLWERPRMNLSQALTVLGAGGSILTPRPIQLRYLPTPLNGTAAGAWTLISETRISLDRVPLVSMTAGNEEADYVVRPIFQDLAYKQVEHWQSSSDQRNILTAGRFAMLASSGVQVDEMGEDGGGFEIGPWKVLTSPDAQGRWYYVEPGGAAIEAGFKDIANLELHMDMMALNPIMSTNRQYVPQNERSLAETRVNSVVHDLSFSCKDAIEEALAMMGRWVGKDLTKISCTLNTNFSGTDERSKSIDSILKAAKDGTLSREGALMELKRLDLLNEDFDIAAEMKRTVVTDVAADGSAPASPKPAKADRDFAKGATRPQA